MKKMRKTKEKNLILMDIKSSYQRVACLSKGLLQDLYLEEFSAPSQVGSVYKAKVASRKEGLKACFVDIGFSASAFLYTGEKGGEMPSDSVAVNPKKLRKGSPLMVQVIKDPLKGKSFRVSDRISLPGFYLVYLPGSPFQIRISRRITDEKTRERLNNFVKDWDLKSGLILRTRAEKAEEKELKKEWESLKNLWEKIQAEYQRQKSPGRIWSGPNIPFQTLRDLLTEEVERVYVEGEKMFLDLKDFVKKNIPAEKHKISLYKSSRPLFEKYNMEREINKLLSKKIRLKSGGFIVIEETEAAVVVDVNTGSFMGKARPEENILKLNLEAGKEILSQIRLRNCGGIVLIDFIDMEEEKSREKLMEFLSRELEKDKAPTRLFPMSGMGVMGLTRKRSRASLLESLYQPCSHCHGLGRLKKQD